MAISHCTAAGAHSEKRATVFRPESVKKQQSAELRSLTSQPAGLVLPEALAQLHGTDFLQATPVSGRGRPACSLAELPFDN